MQLLYKVASFGLPSKITEWIKAFVSDRQYKVRINSNFRDGILSKVVSQREVYWDRFYLLCMKMTDQTFTNDTDLYLFADDAKIYKYTRNVEDQAELQSTLSKMQNW